MESGKYQSRLHLSETATADATGTGSAPTGSCGPLNTPNPESLAEWAPISIEVYDRDGWLVATNPALGSARQDARTTTERGVYNIFEDAQVQSTGRDLELRRVLAGEEVRLTVGTNGPPGAVFQGRRRWLSPLAYPLHGPSGDVTHFVIVHQDLVSRVQTSSRLRLFKRFADASQQGCAWLSLDGRVAYANPAFATLLGAETERALVGELLVSQLGPDDRHLLETVSLPRVLGGETWSGEVMLPGPHGTATPSQADLFLVNDDAGSPAFVGMTLADLSARARAEAERAESEARLQRAQRLESLGVLAGGIAHDFNNLLCGIVGSTELAMQTLSPDHVAQEDLALVLQTSQRAAELCQQMLAYSGRSQLVVGPIDLSQFVHDLTPLLKVSLHHEATLVLHLNPGMPVVAGDSTQLRQVLLNLVMNASEAIGGQSGTVKVSTGQIECTRSFLAEHGGGDLPSGRYAYVEVSDSGSGMDEKVRARAFDPFFSTKFTGRGLGLPAALGIVRGHHGTICIDTALGRGTTVRILLPCAPAVNQPTARGTSPRVDRARGRILLIDDDPSVRAVGQRMLAKLGFEVLAAEDGLSGVRIYSTHRGEFDLVLLDMTMPGLSGDEVCRELRALRSDAKVVLMSGYSEQEATQHFAERSLAGFLAKPFRLETLSACIEEALDGPPDGE